jgi:hypothetical protein
LTPLCLRKDLEEHDHDDTGPECPTERIDQVAHKPKRLRRHRRSERVSTDVRGHAQDEADPEDPVDGIARRLVSRYEPLEALVDEVPYGCIDCGMQVVDGEGRVIGTVLIPPPVLN